ncbi:MAG: restriction endonuclease subunit S [Sphingomonadales bacterium]|nr:restriction endonuclease subunit S [Sphingomonadales bacterium]
MIEGLRPYLEMADTGVAWLPSAPRGWATLRAKYVFQEVDHRSLDGQETHLSMHQKLGLVPSADSGEKRLVSESYAGGKLVEPNDLVLNRLKAHLGVFAYATRPGVISPDYTVLRPLPNAYVRYYEYLLKSPACRGELRTRTKGIVEGFWRLYTDDFYDIRLPVPPLDEQRLIVRFLDWHGAMTGKLIRAKRRLIALLNEQKQSIIHRAVTRGLDPTAKLKLSGVDWLGDVPAHWEVRKLRSLFGRLGSGTTPSGDAYYGGGVPWVASGDLNNEQVSQTQKTVTPKAVAEVSSLRVYPKGSVIVAMYGATIGKTGILAMDACTNQACFVMADPNHNFSSIFCQLVLTAAKQALIEQSYGGGQPNINAEIVKSLKVPCPPSEEQSEIELFVKHEVEEVSKASTLAAQEIALIQEFRARLIADVVTGQLDVRASKSGDGPLRCRTQVHLTLKTGLIVRHYRK